MNPKTKTLLVAAATIVTVSISVNGQLLSDDFESYSAGSALDSSGPWSELTTTTGVLTVRDEGSATPFGTPNQYLDYDDFNGAGSITLLSPGITAAFEAVTTFAFDFYEPSTGGADDLLFGYTKQGGDLTSAEHRLYMSIDDGEIKGISADDPGTSDTYNLDAPYRLYVIFNDTGTAESYAGESIAAQSAGIWIQAIGGPLTFVGTDSPATDETSDRYKVGFRSFSSNEQRALIDNVSLEAGGVLPDSNPPALASTTPSDEGTGVALDANLTATFDRRIIRGTGSITLKKTADDSTVETFDASNPSEVVIAGSSLTVSPSSDLDICREYYVLINAGAVESLTGIAFGGVSSPEVWDFSTATPSSTDYIIGVDEDTVDPALGYYTSSSNLVGVGGAGGERDSRNVVLGFSLPTLPAGETVETASMFFEIIQGRDATGAANLPDLQVYLLDTADPDSSGTTFFADDPSNPGSDVKLVGTTSVTITGTNDNNFDDDEEDRTFALPNEALVLLASFYGGDHIPDQPEAFFRFNLDPLPAIDEYRRYRIDLADDESGIQITGAATTPPALATIMPVDNSTNVNINTDLTANFDKNIVAGTGDIVIRNLTDSNIFATIPVTDGQISISGSTLTIDPASPLEVDKQYAVQIEAGAITDVPGSSFTGIVDPDVTTWNFETSDSVVAPSSKDRIVGRSEEGPSELGYFPDSSSGQVGAGGSSGTRYDRNTVFGYTLPTLAPGSTVSSVYFSFKIETYRNHSGADPALNVYVLDTADPDSTEDAFFYHGPDDPSADAVFVGATDLTVEPGDGTVTFNQDYTYTLSGDALAFVQSLYGGDHIPDQTEVFFRFNLDNLVIGSGPSGLGGSTFDRYFISTVTAESSLQLATVGGDSPYDSWASDKGLDGTPGKENGSNDDPEGDGKSNLYEFAFDGDPLSGADQGKLFLLTNDGVDDRLILTIAVRGEAPAFTGSPSPSSTVDGITYTVEGSLDLGGFTSPVSVISPVATGLPAPNTDYEYRSFSLDGSLNLPDKGFLRAGVTEE